MQIGIIGNGVVGGCLVRWFSRHGIAVKVYDKDPGRCLNTIEEVGRCDMVFICILLTDNASEIGPLRELARWTISPNPIVVRSTVVPGTCEKLQSMFPTSSICFCPEFLTEANAWDDFLHPWIQVVGGPSEAAQKVMGLLPRAPNQMITTTRQAEWIKLATAGFLSTKVSWFNQLYDALGPDDYAIVSEAMDKDARVGKGFKSIFQDGYRGWGGKCFTKDTPCFAEASGMPLMQEVIEYNRKLIEGGK